MGTSTEVTGLVNRHQELVFSVALAVLRDRQAAEDVSQEVFLKALDHVGRVDPARVPAWLATLARRRAIDYLRARRRREELYRRWAERRRVPKASAPSALELLLESLREDDRQIVLLKYAQNLSYREIAAVLGSTPSAVGERLHRVRKKILSLWKGTSDVL